MACGNLSSARLFDAIVSRCDELELPFERILDYRKAVFELESGQRTVHFQVFELESGQYRNEAPYACQVNVRNYISRPTSKDFIQVEIVVEKDSHKMILIGKEGRALKVLATAARLDVEDFLQKKVFLEVVNLVEYFLV